jgi:protein-S-isoprenylcysteine O-methyltransferase Ste14
LRHWGRHGGNNTHDRRSSGSTFAHAAGRVAISPVMADLAHARPQQSYVFWPLFRSLNVLCFLMAYYDDGSSHALPVAIRAIAFMLLAVSLAIFIYAFCLLGRDNSYGASDGLVTEGIYQWTRNPQNTMLIVVYACLAVATDGKSTYILCAAMMAVYALMVLLEEPWLEKVYGDSYRGYCAEVPRFFNWKRATNLVVGGKKNI